MKSKSAAARKNCPSGNGVRAQIEEGEVLRPEELFDVAEIVGNDGFDALEWSGVLRGQTWLLGEESDGAENDGEEKEGDFSRSKGLNVRALKR